MIGLVFPAYVLELLYPTNIDFSIDSHTTKVSYLKLVAVLMEGAQPGELHREACKRRLVEESCAQTYRSRWFPRLRHVLTMHRARPQEPIGLYDAAVRHIYCLLCFGPFNRDSVYLKTLLKERIVPFVQSLGGLDSMKISVKCVSMET
jgi:hypothetical protein